MPKEKVYYWPLWLSELLSESERNKIKNDLPKLQRAQVFLWRALNIYDDFFDGAGTNTELILVNDYFQKYLEIHYRLNLNNDYYNLFNKLFINLNRANRQEIIAPKLKTEHSLISLPNKLPRVKRLDYLSNKSLVLALGPIALLSLLGYKNADSKFKSTLKFFKYALAAKQLADDSYDWLEDLKSGLITPANYSVAQAIKRKKLKINFHTDLTVLNLLFAQEASPFITEGLNNLCFKARREMKHISQNKENNLLSQLILPLEKACREVERFQLLLS